MALCLLLLAQCQKIDHPDQILVTNTQKYKLDLGSKVTAEIGGLVLNESGMPVSNATVTVGNQTVNTNASGYFIVSGAEVYQKHTFIKVHASGYFHGSRAIIPQEGVNDIEITLLSNAKVASFSATDGGTATVGSSSVQLPAGFTDMHGNPYNGTVNVAMKYLDPEASNINSIMPGDLVAATSNGDQRLQTFGMLAVELTDSKGAQVKMKNGSEAIIRMPVPGSLAASASPKIPLWYFDEKAGYWVEEGEASLVNGEYVGKVKHFTFWNVDKPFAASVVKGRVVNSEGTPIAGAYVTAKSKNYGSATSLTTSQGNFSGRIPSNEVVELSISFRHLIGNSAKIMTIGPFESDAEIPEIVVEDIPDFIKISGTIVDCDNQLFFGGKVIVDGASTVEVVAGTYTFFYPKGKSFSIWPYDGVTREYGNKAQFPGYSENTTLPNQKLCVTGGGSNYGAVKWTMSYTLDGQSVNRSNQSGYYATRTPNESEINVACGVLLNYVPEFELVVANYDGARLVNLNEASSSAMWIGNSKSAHPTISENVTLVVDRYVNNSDMVYMDFEFYGTVKVWNEDLNKYESKSISNGRWRYIK